MDRNLYCALATIHTTGRRLLRSVVRENILWVSLIPEEASEEEVGHTGRASIRSDAGQNQIRASNEGGR